MAPYEALKRSVPKLSEASEAELGTHAHQGPGTRTLFSQLLERLHGGVSTLRIADIYQEWRARCG